MPSQGIDVGEETVKMQTQKGGGGNKNKPYKAGKTREKCATQKSLKSEVDGTRKSMGAGGRKSMGGRKSVGEKNEETATKSMGRRSQASRRRSSARSSKRSSKGSSVGE